jgi:hypothetical protein
LGRLRYSCLRESGEGNIDLFPGWQIAGQHGSDYCDESNSTFMLEHGSSFQTSNKIVLRPAQVHTPPFVHRSHPQISQITQIFKSRSNLRPK